MLDTSAALAPKVESNKLAHYVLGGSGGVLEALVNGTSITAICGYTWVPTRDPERFPSCPDCEQIAVITGLLNI